MRVALVGPYPVDPRYIPGGVAAVTHNLVQGLRHHPDLQLHVIAMTKSLAASQIVKDGNISIHYLAEPRKRLIPNLLANPGRIHRVLAQIKPDLVHSQFEVGTLAGVAAGYPTVYSIHGIPHQAAPFSGTLSRRVAAWLEVRLAKYAISRVKHCIATSYYASQAYEGYTSAQMHFVFNPVEDAFFSLNHREIDGKIMSPTQIRYLKNNLGLVKAFELIHSQDSNARLFICGKTIDTAYHTVIKNYISSHGLQQAVHLLGFISQEELERHFSEAAVICLFSRQESAPMAIAQAMCAGKPVVASAVGGTPEFVLNGETGFLVDDDDQPAFADKMIQLISDPVLRRKMGARARDIAEQRFRKEKVAARTLEVYSEVLSA